VNPFPQEVDRMPQLTVQQAYELALQHYQAGRLPEAEKLCLQILAGQKTNFDVIFLLGVIIHQARRDDAAVELLRHAIALRPDCAEAFSNLGNILKDKGRIDEALAASRQAIALNPNLPEAHNNLGSALMEKGQPNEAIAVLRQAIALRPHYAEAFCNLGIALKELGQLDEAIAAWRRAIALNPGFAEAHSNLGDALKNKGQLDDAIASIRHAIVLNPKLPEAHNNLGSALKDKGRLDEAIAACEQAIALRPDYAEAFNNLGMVLKDKGRPDEAIAAFRKAIALNPRLSETFSNLGNALKDKDQYDEAIAAHRQAIALNPDMPEAYNNLGNPLQDMGQIDEAIAAYRKAIALKPAFAQAHSNLIFAIQNHSGYDAETIAEEHRAWDRQIAQPLREFILPHDNNRDPNRPLRIGYVSPDFRDHAVSRFLLPLFRHHDHAACRIVCYSDVPHADAVTERLRACADEWRDIFGLSDERVAAQIRDDKIDLLVDLAGHTAANRLLLFARKPAPVQITYLGYPATSGLSAMDYRFTDRFADPPGMTESFHSEKLWRLPDCNWCFNEPADAPPLRTTRADGPIRFGTFNKYTKASPLIMESWAAILNATPSSRLIFKSRGLGVPSIRSHIIEFFKSRGLGADRLDIRGSNPDVRTHLDAYNQMDISLDTFPYHGTTTTCEALWMGVPVVTLAGPTHISRVSVSLLNCVGLPQLIAQSAEEYVSIAVRLAADLPRLAELHRTIQGKMRASPLMDGAKFARSVEAAYRRMWRTWCETASAGS
jgi:protein O-GlcNAc transferase